MKVRPKTQLTLPEEIRRALHIGEGDEVEFAVHDDGTTFTYGAERIAGQAHVIWRRIGTHAIFTPPPGP